ncbi:MAG: IS1096 element passenger TnpR family protein [Luteibaculaceae bacterium]
MSVFKFRVLIDHDSNAFRDIEILESHQLNHFNHAILDAFDFKGNEMSSFFHSNEKWEKGQEFPLVAMDFDEEEPTLEMDKVSLKSFVAGGTGHYLFVYDFLRMWCFYVELVGQRTIEEGEKNEDFPKLALQFGTAPNELDKEIESDEFGDFDDLDDEFDEDFDSLDDLDIDENFEDFDFDNDYR